MTAVFGMANNAPRMVKGFLGVEMVGNIESSNSLKMAANDMGFSYDVMGQRKLCIHASIFIVKRTSLSGCYHIHCPFSIFRSGNKSDITP